MTCLYVRGCSSGECTLGMVSTVAGFYTLEALAPHALVVVALRDFARCPHDLVAKYVPRVSAGCIHVWRCRLWEQAPIPLVSVWHVRVCPFGCF